MSNTNDKMIDRYVYLHISDSMVIHTKLDDEGVVVDLWDEDIVIASAYKSYDDMNVEIVDNKKALAWDTMYEAHQPNPYKDSDGHMVEGDDAEAHRDLLEIMDRYLRITEDEDE
jgi:hypothetical protein